MDVTNSRALVDKLSVFLRFWIVNVFDGRADYHNEAPVNDSSVSETLDHFPCQPPA